MTQLFISFQFTSYLLMHLHIIKRLHIHEYHTHINTNTINPNKQIQGHPPSLPLLQCVWSSKIFLCFKFPKQL